eukprot:3337084-Pyramimonas_sp.AAC.1
MSSAAVSESSRQIVLEMTSSATGSLLKITRESGRFPDDQFMLAPCCCGRALCSGSVIWQDSEVAL